MPLKLLLVISIPIGIEFCGAPSTLRPQLLILNRHMADKFSVWCCNAVYLKLAFCTTHGACLFMICSACPVIIFTTKHCPRHPVFIFLVIQFWSNVHASIFSRIDLSQFRNILSRKEEPIQLRFILLFGTKTTIY